MNDVALTPKPRIPRKSKAKSKESQFLDFILKIISHPITKEFIRFLLLVDWQSFWQDHF